MDDELTADARGKPLTVSSLVLACALEMEERAARSSGLPAALVGVGARGPLPDGDLVSFGVAGALTRTLPPGTVVAATRIVDERGRTVWTGVPPEAVEAEPVVVCGVARVVDEVSEREALAAASGASVVDMESAALAATGRLAAVVRVIADTPQAPLGRLAQAATTDGGTDWAAAARAFLLEPRRAFTTARNARLAFAALELAAAQLAAGRDRR